MNRYTFFFCICIAFFSCSEDEVPGCTDPASCNFNPLATTTDGSCEGPGDPCNDGDPFTQDDQYSAECECVGFVFEEGCTDDDSCTYDPDANVSNPDDCAFPGDSCNDGDPTTTNDIYNGDCDCVGTSIMGGCTDPNACNFDSGATEDNGSCQYPGDPCNDGNPQTENDVYTVTCDCEGEPIPLGCIVNADGYSPITVGVFSDQYFDECEYIVYQTTDPNNASETYTCDSEGLNTTNIALEPGTNWTVAVYDSYGDGKGANGYYFATCPATNGETIEIFNTAFTDGISSSTAFEIP